MLLLTNPQKNKLLFNLIHFNKIICRCCIGIAINICCVSPTVAQTKWVYTGYFNTGLTLNMNYGPSQKFPGLRVYAAFTASGVYNNHFTVNYGPSVSIYTKSLGANLNPLIGDIQIDFINSINFGWSMGKQLGYTKFFKSMNNAAFYNMSSNKSTALFLGSNFILNNHRRNQVVGSFTASFPGITVNYYNDGAFPFDKVPVADNFDRWWTGGFGFYLHNRENYNNAEFSFDQFTGYSPLLYELSNIIGIDLPDYNADSMTVEQKRKTLSPAFNTSAYNLRFFPTAGFGADVGIIGSLRSTKTGKVFGLQDIIHTLGRYPLHPNNDINRIYIGGTYNKLINVKLQ
jgi:hypothetical protein